MPELPPVVDLPPAVKLPPAQASGVDDILSVWAGIINHVKAKKISAASYLQEGYPVSLEGRTLMLGFPKELKFHKEVLESAENRALIEEALKDVVKADLKVTFTIVEPVRPKGGLGRDMESSGYDERGPGATPEAEPLINDALQIFGGEIALRSSPKRK